MGFESPAQEPKKEEHVVGVKKNRDGTFDYSKAARMETQKPIRSEEERLKIENEIRASHARMFKVNIEYYWRFGLKEWGELESALEKVNITPEEEDAVRYTLQVLKSSKQLRDKESFLKRSANRVADVERAHKIFQRMSDKLDRELYQNINITTSLLIDALSDFADETDRYEAELVRSGQSKENTKRHPAEKNESTGPEMKQETELRKDLKKRIGTEMHFLGGRLLYPFPYDMSFDKLSDEQFEMLTNSISELGKKWRNDKRLSFEKNKEYITKVNDVLTSFKPK